MDLFLLCGIAVSLLGVIISLYFFQKKRNAEIKELQNQQRARNVPQRLQEGLPRRAQIMRNQRNRLRNSAAAADAGTSGGTSVVNDNRYVDNDNDDDDSDLNDNRNAISTDEKIGTKKRAKLEAKAEKRAQREAELQLREERKRKEQQLDEQRKIEEKKAEEEEKKRIEAERLAKEEKERKEYEEYLKLKENFSIDEEGYEENLDDDNGERNLLQEFIDYIKDNKVVVLEDVASHFKMKTQQVIERIMDLRDNNKLTGVIDDRGKFIYISENELKSVAKFIRQRGRVSIAELAECSNNLINLNSIKC